MGPRKVLGWSRNGTTHLSGVEEVDQVGGGRSGGALADGDQAARCKAVEGFDYLGSGNACVSGDLAGACGAGVVWGVLGLSGEVESDAELGWLEGRGELEDAGCGGRFR